MPTNFRHRGQDSVLDGNKEKESGFFYNDGSDYMVTNHAPNRASSDCGEQEEMAPAEYQGKTT